MVHTLADITGTGAAVALSVARVQANWIQFTIPVTQSTGVTTNTAAVRVGDKSVSATRGTSVPTTGMLFPPIAEGQYLDLSLVYAFVGNNDKLQVTYGVL
jgi:hypothetical protein